jgi:predicted nucleic acid-binding protein
MSGNKAFLDTNILVYLYSSKEPKKRDMCIAAVERYTRIVSTQTLNEFSNVLFKKQGLTSADVWTHVQNVKQIAEVKDIDFATIGKAIALKGRYGYSYYDSLMIASALDSGCEVFFSEDMSGGQTIEGKLLIVNPFNDIGM